MTRNGLSAQRAGQFAGEDLAIDGHLGLIAISGVQRQIAQRQAL